MEWTVTLLCCRVKALAPAAVVVISASAGKAREAALHVEVKLEENLYPLLPLETVLF